MTQFACSVILHASILRLCWRTIKVTNGDPNRPPASDPDTQPDQDGQPLQTSSLDVEIPQLWTLIACHTIYVGVLECLVSWLPFYYYVKMLLLLVTFIPGTRFPNYWFQCWLVPGIDRLHSALDLDWRTYLAHQLRYLPFLVLDLLFVPGILGDDNDDVGREVGRDRRVVAEEDAVAASELQSPSKSRSRLVASGLQLRNFSREHAPWTPSAAKVSMSMSTLTPRKKMTVQESLTATPTMRSLLAQTPTTAKTDRSRRRRRRTMNEKFRKVLCGDENIRIRDYLFDLDMPSLPVQVGEEDGRRLNEEGRQRVISSSADRDGDERRRKQKEQNRRRRRTFGGTLVRREEFMSSSISGDAKKVGEESNSNDDTGGGETTSRTFRSSSGSASTKVRRSRRIAKKQECTKDSF